MGGYLLDFGKRSSRLLCCVNLNGTEPNKTNARRKLADEVKAEERN